MSGKLITSESLLPALKISLKNIDVATLPSAFVGFDGFVDSIQKAVKKGGNGEPIYFKTIHDFARHLDHLDGQSGQVEFVTSQVKMGGNAPILSSALGKLGVKSNCLGTMGFPEVNPLFRDRNHMVELMSVSPPGKSNAVEFDNGKIIFSDLSTLQGYNWAYIKRRVNFSTLRKTAEKSRLLALVDWANLPHATDLWRGFLNDVIKPIGKMEQYFLFDLCDPSKKTVRQIDEVLDLISSFSDYGSVILGLNENEANTIWLALNGFNHSSGKREKMPSLQTVGYFIYRAMNIETLLIHPIDRMLVFKNRKKNGKHSLIELHGQVIKKPKVQTGGGDNLNAGFCLGLLLGFEIEKCMVLAMATSGAYVQNGTSPTIQDIIDYVKKWSGEVEIPPEKEPANYFVGF